MSKPFETVYKIIGATIRPHEQTTTYSIKSDDPHKIIGWLGKFIDDHLGCEVLFDHDYGDD